MSWTLAIETGGTFTDLFMAGPEGQVHVAKIPSTPKRPAQAAEAALRAGFEVSGTGAAEVGRLLHGSTVAVNALIERAGTPPVLIATRGFRDMLFIGRQEKTHIYDMFYQKPGPFIERAGVYEIEERIAADGEVIEAIEPEAVVALVDRIVTETGTSTVAVCLLHSYANPSHEQLIERVIRDRHPNVRVVLSSDVCPVHREFERASTTVINAWLHPVVDAYLAEFGELVDSAGCAATPLIMQANGGMLPIEASRRRPAGLYLSGPSAAVAGAVALAKGSATHSLITLDVGGTSTDICLVTEGEVHESGHGGSCGVVQGQPLNQVMTDIVTIGAGGGSLAWVDSGGMLKVGPRSAGADPGPACYGRSGTGFTLSDAFICLGLLEDGATLPGGIRLSLGAARDAGGPLAAQLGVSVGELAESVYRIAVANMAEAIRSVTIRRGLDPREYALFACGGAGPLMAAQLAGELEIDTVLVPPDPGVFSAFGLTAAGLRMDFAHSVNQGTDLLKAPDELGAVMKGLHAQASAQFEQLGVPVEALDVAFSADARYVGQGFELRVAFPPDASPDDVAAAFHDAHATRYGHSFSDQPIELTAIRAVASVPPPFSPGQWRSTPSDVQVSARTMTVEGAARPCDVVDRAGLTKSMKGPALVVESTTATYVPSSWTAEAEAAGLLRLTGDNP